MLTVRVCHLTQFAFFWTFFAQHGLIQFDKTHEIFGKNGDVLVSRKWHVTQLELPIRRGKGANGNITITWDVTTNNTDKSLIWPSNGTILMQASQWNSSFVLNVADDETKAPQQTYLITLKNTTGGAVLAKDELIKTRILIESNVQPSIRKPISPAVLWGIVSASIIVILSLAIMIAVCVVRRKRKSASVNDSNQDDNRVFIPREGAMYETLEMRNGEENDPPPTTGKVHSSSTDQSETLYLRSFDWSEEGLSDASTDSITDISNGKKRKKSSKKKEKPLTFTNQTYGAGSDNRGKLETAFTEPAMPHASAGEKMLLDVDNPTYGTSMSVKEGLKSSQSPIFADEASDGTYDVINHPNPGFAKEESG